MPNLHMRYLIIFAYLFLCSCREEKIYVSSEYRDYEIVEVDAPKHFSVSLLDVKTHQLFSNESRSKHCNRWREIQLHEVIKIKTTYYKYEGSDNTYAELENMNDHFCG